MRGARDDERGRADEELVEDPEREVTVGDDRAGDAAVAERGEEGGAGGLQAGAVGDRGVDLAARAFDREIGVGRAFAAVEVGGVDPGAGEVTEKVGAGGVGADRREEGDRAVQRGEGERDVEGDAAGAADDPAGNVGAGRQRFRGAADDVPVRRADADERRRSGHQASGAKRSLM